MHFPTSVSTPNITELDRKEFLNLIRASSHNVASASLFSHDEGDLLRKKISPFTVTFSAVKTRFLYLNKRVRSLEQVNSALKHDNLVAQGEISLLTDELHSTRMNLYNEIDLRRKDAAQVEEAEKKILDLREQVKRYGDFVSIMAKLGIDNPLYCASLSVMSRVEAEDALIDSIVEAAKDKHSPWARIISAIVGPRSPSNYVSAINLTLQTRQNLREREKICQYWKLTAQQCSEHSELLTPSSSQLSDLHLVDFKRKTTPKGFPKELEDMIDALNRGAIKTDLPIPHPEIDEMEEWLSNELSEEPSHKLNTFALSQTHDQRRQPISLGSETIGILKKSDTPRKIVKQPAPAQQRVRFDIEEAEDTTEQKSTGSEDSESDSVSSEPSDISSSRGTVTEQSIRNSTYTSPLTPTFPFTVSDRQIVAQDSPSTVERCVVPARGSTSQLKTPSEPSIQPSPSKCSSFSSGSEYEESVTGSVSDESTVHHSYREGLHKPSEGAFIPQATDSTTTSTLHSKILHRHDIATANTSDSARPVTSRPDSPKIPPHELTTESHTTHKKTSASSTSAKSSGFRLSSRFSDSALDSDYRTSSPLVLSNTSPDHSPQRSAKKLSPSRLAVPRITYGNRPALQSIDLNASALSTNRNLDLAPPVRCSADPFISKPMQGSAAVKNLSKRRGLIMMENFNIESSLITPASKTLRDLVTPNICEMEISSPAVFDHSVSPKSLANTPVEAMVTKSKTDQTVTPDSPPTMGRNPCSEGRESATGLVSASYESQISALVASMSDSDLGSLEMTDESDSNSETLGKVVTKRSTLNTLPRVCKNIMDGSSKASTNSRGNIGKQSRRVLSDHNPMATSSRLPSNTRPQRLISATFGASASSESMPTSTSSSSSSSSALLDSPTRRMSAVSQPARLVLGHRTTRCGSVSTPVKISVKSSVSSVSVLPKSTQQAASPFKSSIPSPQKFRSEKLASVAVESPSKKGKERAQDSLSTLVQPSQKVGKKVASKPSSPTDSTSRASKQQKSATDPSPSREPKVWMARGIFSKFTKPHSVSSVTAPLSEKAPKSSLSPNGSVVSPVKPRSNTIATVARSIPRPTQFTEPSTKPRSNTVNTYSPVIRSPLSQHVTNSSVDSQSLSSIRSSATPVPPSSISTYPNKPKSVTPSRIAQPASKSIAPPHCAKKPGGTLSTVQNTGPSPPSAAFMIKSKPPTRRRIDSSVTPLIPSSANGVISPSQCRSLLRNTLSLAVR